MNRLEMGSTYSTQVPVPFSISTPVISTQMEDKQSPKKCRKIALMFTSTSCHTRYLTPSIPPSKQAHGHVSMRKVNNLICMTQRSGRRVGVAVVSLCCRIGMTVTVIVLAMMARRRRIVRMQVTYHSMDNTKSILVKRTEEHFWRATYHEWKTGTCRSYSIPDQRPLSI